MEQKTSCACVTYSPPAEGYFRLRIVVPGSGATSHDGKGTGKALQGVRIRRSYTSPLAGAQYWEVLRPRREMAMA